MDTLLPLLEELLPQIVRWAQEQEEFALRNGTALSQEELEIATQIGARFPEKVRLLKVESIPIPDDETLRDAAQKAGLASENTAGMALRYGIFIRADIWESRTNIVAHELVHTCQYERLGGFAPFLQQYLGECLAVGYADSPLELEAIETAKSLYS